MIEQKPMHHCIVVYPLVTGHPLAKFVPRRTPSRSVTYFLGEAAPPGTRSEGFANHAPNVPQAIVYATLASEGQLPELNKAPIEPNSNDTPTIRLIGGWVD
jgi:hypothetical protein